MATRPGPAGARATGEPVLPGLAFAGPDGAGMRVDVGPQVTRMLREAAEKTGRPVESVLSDALALAGTVEQRKGEGARVTVVFVYPDGRRAEVPL